MTRTLDTEKIIARHISKGINREHSTKLLAELVEACAAKNLRHALAYHNLITKSAAEKWHA